MAFGDIDINKIKDSIHETQKHIMKVDDMLECVKEEIEYRQINHDSSKMEYPELEVFTIYTEKLKYSTYGSDEYKGFLKEMKIALDHHYEQNRHHPEHFSQGISGMNLVDLIEMMCDWKAATMRHDDGDIYNSLEINKERFGIDDQLFSVLKNTVDSMNSEWEELR